MKELFLTVLYKEIENKVAEKALNKLKEKYPLITINFMNLGPYSVRNRIKIKIADNNNNIEVDSIQQEYGDLLHSEIANEMEKIAVKLTKEE